MDMSTFQAQATLAAKMLKAMANKNRLMVLCVLLSGEMSVAELNAKVPLSQSALSQHLAHLKASGLVAIRKQAQQVFYRLEGNAARHVLEVLQKVYCSEFNPVH